MVAEESVVIPNDPTEQQLIDALLPVFIADPERFKRAVQGVKQAADHQGRPQFPRGVDVSAIPRVPADEVDAFKERYISSAKLPYDSDEAQERWKSNGRPVQYARWRWATENIATYVNMLREYGHGDDAIQRMLDGVPMCFKTREDYDAIRAALKDLAPKVADEMGWDNVGFVITGSSVPGFSQNPIKGHADIPSKITDADNSDVDIVIVADGVNVTVAERLRKEHKAEPKRAFPSTASEITNGMRFGCHELDGLSKSVAAFHEKWDKILPGGLQFTFSENDLDLPPWESRIDIVNV